MLWEIEIRPAAGEVDREAARVLAECRSLGLGSINEVAAAKSFLLETDADRDAVAAASGNLLVDDLVELHELRRIDGGKTAAGSNGNALLNVLFKPGVTDNVAGSTQRALEDLGLPTTAVATCRKYWVNANADEAEVNRLSGRVLANDAIERVVRGPLAMDGISMGGSYAFEKVVVPLRELDDDALVSLSREGQLSLSLVEMQTIQKHFADVGRDPTDVELETIAQTWSEHCSHKTLAGRVHYVDDERDVEYANMLKETIFAATVEIRKRLGDDDWCLSVFEDNAGVVTFDEEDAVCFKVETHNHPSAIEPYGGANTGIGGVIRDPMGTGLGAKPLCNTDVFCFAPPDTPTESLPPGVLHPKHVMEGVVAGVRDYGNRMGIPTVNGAICFDERYLGNPLVYCGNVALLPNDKVRGAARPGDLIVAIGGRTGRDGIHGATFSSVELTEESESTSGGAVQIGNAITEKTVMDAVLEARDRDLFSAITDCGAGGFSSAVGEMGEKTGAKVKLENAPLKYSGLSYTEIWISEAQERMVLAVPPENWDEFEAVCEAEGVEACILGEFTDTQRLELTYEGTTVGDVAMEFLHDGRPPIVRDARYTASPEVPIEPPANDRFDDDLLAILGSPNVCSKEWVIRQYDHEVQAGSVVKPLVGVRDDGPSDAAVVRPKLNSNRGLVVSCGINPRYGDLDPYWMAASAIDEAVRNCVAVGADPAKIAILDNFCWGNTERPEVLGSLTRAAIACHDVAIAYGTPFVSGKDSLYNEFAFTNEEGEREVVVIPATLLISALGQIADVSKAVTMDLKQAGNVLLLVGETKDELGGSHFAMVNDLAGGAVPKVDLELAPKVFAAVHSAINDGFVRSCHDLSEGGLAVAAAEMAFAGGLGLELELPTGLAPHVQLFSESNTRFLLEVPESSAAGLFEFFEEQGVPVALVGRVVESPAMRVASGNEIQIDLPLDVLKDAWQSPLAWN